jgi:hypothetical protein
MTGYGCHVAYVTGSDLKLVCSCTCMLGLKLLYAHVSCSCLLFLTIKKVIQIITYSLKYVSDILYFASISVSVGMQFLLFLHAYLVRKYPTL